MLLNANTYIDSALDLILKYGPKVVLAIVTLVVGFIVIKSITKGSKRLMERRKTDPTLRPFLLGMISILLKILLIISIMSMIGIEMTSFIAILGAAGLAVGLALQGTLQNFAGGVILLLFKPFKVGDFIESQGIMGTVSEIQIFNTILKTPDNRVIILPNSPLATNNLTNFTKEPNRRVDLAFGIGYDDDIDKAREVIEEVIKRNEKVLNEPAPPFIAVSELADSSVNFAVRIWTKTEDYWEVYFYMHETVKKEFDKQGISIPYPQTDVHIHQVKQ